MSLELWGRDKDVAILNRGLGLDFLVYIFDIHSNILYKVPIDSQRSDHNV
jgi:hypothetical protein